jgi:NAD(P)-dependent dehydrogenase (short-subunit alcohol dehydrogenase family)
MDEVRNGLPMRLRTSLIPIELDATSTDSVSRSVKTIESRLLSLPPNARVLIGLVNCPSPSSTNLAPIEATTPATWTQEFRTVAVNPMTLSAAYVPLLRASSGRIVNISTATSTASPLDAPRAGAKMALEAASDALRVELHRWRVPVSLVLPSATESVPRTTDTTSRAMYKPLVRGVESVLRELRASDPGPVVDAVKHALFAEIPCTR